MFALTKGLRLMIINNILFRKSPLLTLGGVTLFIWRGGVIDLYCSRGHAHPIDDAIGVYHHEMMCTHPVAHATEASTRSFVLQR